MKNQSFSIALLKGVIQHYAWGGYDYIPRLLQIENRMREPYAELWFGAHAKAPSKALIENKSVSLDALIKKQLSVLGDFVVAKFGACLPYLLKVLDARDMLSIQVHPTKQQAEAGFARENKLGVPLNAPHRNYKDDNHKPEVHVALTDFWMLHSFRPEEEIAELLATAPEFMPLADIFEDGGIEGLYKRIMQAPQRQIDAMLEPLIQRLEQEQPQDMDQPDYWALKASKTFPLPYGFRDRGIFSIYLLNLLHLKPGQGTFQDAGVLHAYLQGTNIELMANSDNVLRGGLTPKHNDVDELLKIVTYRCGRPGILMGDKLSEIERVYKTPAPDFELRRLQLSGGQTYNLNSSGPEIVLIIAGNLLITLCDETLSLSHGQALFISAGTALTLKSSAKTVLYCAAVPQQ